MSPFELDPIEQLPDHRRKSTWRICLAVDCNERVDPWDHSFRCPAHRTKIVDRRRVAFATADDVRHALADAELRDPDFGARLLAELIDGYPNLVANTLTMMVTGERRRDDTG